MIQIDDHGPKIVSAGSAVQGAADSYVETSPEDILETPEAAFAVIDSDDPTAPGNLSESFRRASGTTSAGRGMSPLPGSDRKDTETPTNRLTARGAESTNGPEARNAQAQRNEKRNPRTGNLARARDRLGQPLANIGKAGARSLWTTFLCGPEPKDDRRGRSKERSNTNALWLRSTGCSAANLIDFLKVEGGKVGIDKDFAKKRMEQAIGASLSTINRETRTLLAKNLAEETGADEEVLVAVANGEPIPTAAEDADKVTTLDRIVRATKGESILRLFDLQAEAALLNTLLDMAISLGIPGAILALLDKIEDDKVKQRVLLNRLRQSAYASDIDSIEETIKLTSMSRVRSKVPDLVSLILKHYRLPPRTKKSEHPAQSARLISLVTQIDPNWFQTRRQNEWVLNLEHYSECSDDATMLLMMDPNHQLNAMMAKTYPREHKHEVARRLHPYAVLRYGRA